MLRLVILLLFAMGLAWFTLGQDKGQLRPGLAKAEEEGRLDALWAEARAREAAEAEPALAVAEPTPLPAPEPTPEPAPALAMTEPVTPDLIVTPEPAMAEAGSETVFTLQGFGTETAPDAEVASTEAAAPEAPAPDQGRIWYVRADSVNVRAEPSTDAEVLGKLAQGEALLLIATAGEDWARIVIQGDGIEGYVATRFLSPTAP